MAYALQYYDLVLAAIGGSLAVGSGVGLLTSVALPTAVVAFGLVAVAFLAHALFVNGPVDEPADLAEEVDPEEVPMAPSGLAAD